MEGVFVPLSIKVWCRMADVDDDDDLRDSAGSRLTSKASVDEQLPEDDDYDLTNRMNRAARYYKRDSDLSTLINDGAYSLVAYRVYSLFGVPNCL